MFAYTIVTQSKNTPASISAGSVCPKQTFNSFLIIIWNSLRRSKIRVTFATARLYFWAHALVFLGKVLHRVCYWNKRRQWHLSMLYLLIHSFIFNNCIICSVEHLCLLVTQQSRTKEPASLFNLPFCIHLSHQGGAFLPHSNKNIPAFSKASA